VKLIIVLGHTECGAIKAYIEDKDNLYKNIWITLMIL
jgi:carbonic anhydrase